MRTGYCGHLTAADVGRAVDLCGWVSRRREHGEHLAFVDLRDHTGIVQCVVDHAHDLRSEYVIRVSGTVRVRPPGTANPALATGEIEVGECSVEVLSTAEPPPFPVTDHGDGGHTGADEVVRLRHRYVDLRRDRMQRNLRLRARVNAILRRSMEDQGFVEVETPMLMPSTPEGARDFVVPSRFQPGSFYALPQSPQLFKQLCMVGGLDRYYQIARCLRDEDLRADRQFEFMQLDVEASFVDQEDVISFVSQAVIAAAEVTTGEPVPEIRRMPWLDAMERFGTDKPDLRFGMELVDLTSAFEATEFNAFRAPCVKGIRVPGGADFSRARLDRLTDQARQLGAKGLVWMRVGEAGALDSPVARFLSEQELSATALALAVEPGDLVLVVADERPTVRHVLGLLRVELGRRPAGEGGLQFLWVTAFPMFEGTGADGRPVPAHHPFTMPEPDDVDRLEEDPLSVRSLAYDLVLNGLELGSGSVRIHRPDVQERVFSLLGLEPDQVRARFGFLLDAFRYGAPPHAGFALGIDRLVALLTGEETIRDVIAFPKTQSGADPLTGAPRPLSPAQLSELGLAFRH